VHSIDGDPRTEPKECKAVGLVSSRSVSAWSKSGELIVSLCLAAARANADLILPVAVTGGWARLLPRLLQAVLAWQCGRVDLCSTPLLAASMQLHRTENGQLGAAAPVGGGQGGVCFVSCAPRLALAYNALGSPPMR
jgi:hypothetical protein